MLNSEIEILAPCGSFDILKTAIKAGADACYIGGSRYGARAYADNLSDNQLEAAIDYAHIHGKKLYLTVNTLIKESELSDAFSYIKDCYEAGIDAFIVQDLGLFKLIHDNFSDVHIHCSTQMNITSYHAASYMKKMGASRIVTAREMKLEDIREIKEKVDVEIETFVHGAMCYSYSGQCLMSSLAGGRSGNRGRCAQPCRKCYDGEYILSMKDMCTLSYIPKLAEAGIDSFKIEGRMKNEYYVASAVDAYKELTEDYLKGGFSEEKAKKYEFRLANIYNRGGFCKGYFFMHNGPEMISKNRPNNQGVKIGRLAFVKDGKVFIDLCEDIFKGDILEIKTNNNEVIEITSGNDYASDTKVSLNAPKTRQLVINQDIYRTRCKKILDDVLLSEKRGRIGLIGYLKAKKGEALSFEIKESKLNNPAIVKITSDTIEASKTSDADEDMIISKLYQTGDTDYYFEDILLDVDKDAFVPAGLVKKVRREAISSLENVIKKSYKRKTDAVYQKNSCFFNDFDETVSTIRLKVGVKNLMQLRTVIKHPGLYGIYMDKSLYLDIKNEEIYKELKKRNIKIYIELQYVVNNSFDGLDYLNDMEYDGIYIRNIDAFSSEIDYNKDIVLGSGVYAYNNLARSFMCDRFSDAVFEIPKELNISEIKCLNDKPAELCIYEYQQVMLSNNCVKKSRGNCNKKSEFSKITDDKGNSFFTYSKCDECINVTYNGIPFLIFDKKELINLKGVKYYRINFTLEDEIMVDKIMNCYNDKVKPDFVITTGHMHRGVE